MRNDNVHNLATIFLLNHWVCIYIITSVYWKSDRLLGMPNPQNTGLDIEFTFVMCDEINVIFLGGGAAILAPHLASYK